MIGSLVGAPSGTRLVTRAVGSLPSKRCFAERPGLTERANGSRCSRHMRRHAEEMEDLPKTYASALLDLAQRSDILDQVHSDIDTLQAVLTQDRQVRRFLTDPVARKKDKRQVIDELKDSANLTDQTVNFLKVLLQDDRLGDAPIIFSNFETLYCQRTDTEVATVYSPVKLDAEQKFKVAQEIQKLTGAESVKLKNVIDRSIIAGLVIDYGSEQIDLSVRGKLEDVAQDLVDEGANMSEGAPV